jgi:hypothetical protein
VRRGSLNERLASEDAHVAPEPETAEERVERLLPKRRWLGLLGLVAATAWAASELFLHMRGLGFVAAAIVVILGVLFAYAEEDDDDE